MQNLRKLAKSGMTKDRLVYVEYIMRKRNIHLKTSASIQPIATTSKQYIRRLKTHWIRKEFLRDATSRLVHTSILNIFIYFYLSAEEALKQQIINIIGYPIFKMSFASMLIQI